MVRMAAEGLRVMRVALLCLIGGGWSAALAADRPASTAEAAQVIDFRVWPALPGATTAMQRTLAQLSYRAPGDVKAAYDFHRQQLLGQEWVEQPQGYVTEQSAQASFKRQGFTVSLSVNSAGPGQSLATLTNHGNFPAAQLPLPQDATLLFSGPVSAMYQSASAPEEAAAAIAAELLRQGWEPYGTAGEQRFFRCRGVRASVRATAASAQQGKTLIELFTEQLSAELPAAPRAERVQYADTTAQLTYDFPASAAEAVDFYRQTLGPQGWKSTTSQPVRIDFRDELIFANPVKDILILQTTQVDGKLRVQLRQLTANQVAEMERAALARIEARAAKSAQGAPKVSLKLPPGARDVAAGPTKIEFKLAAGRPHKH
jgi:hypothetical protein